MTSPLTDGIREQLDDGRIGTHSFDCWKWHRGCAALLAADRLDAIDALHQPDRDGERANCRNCINPWPCPTHRLLHGESE